MQCLWLRRGSIVCMRPVSDEFSSQKASNKPCYLGTPLSSTKSLPEYYPPIMLTLHLNEFPSCGRAIISLASQLFAQQYIQASNNESIKAPHYSFVMRIHHWLVSCILYMAITITVDILSINGAKPSASTVLNTKLSCFVFNDFRYVFSNYNISFKVAKKILQSYALSMHKDNWVVRQAVQVVDKNIFISKRYNKSSQRLPNTPICQHQWMPCLLTVPRIRIRNRSQGTKSEGSI